MLYACTISSGFTRLCFVRNPRVHSPSTKRIAFPHPRVGNALPLFGSEAKPCTLPLRSCGSRRLEGAQAALQRLVQHPSYLPQCFPSSGHDRKTSRRARRRCRLSPNSQQLLHKIPARLQRSDVGRSNPLPAWNWSPDSFLCEESSTLAHRNFYIHGSSTVLTPIRKLHSRP